MDQHVNPEILSYFDLVPVAILLLDKQGKIIYKNQNCHELSGHFSLGKSIDDIAGMAFWCEVFQFYSQRKNTQYFEKNIVCNQDDENITYAIRFFPIQLSFPDNFIAVILPKETFPSINLAFLEQSPLAIAVTNYRGQFLRVNTAFCSLLKKSEVALIHCTDLSLTYPSDIKTEKEKRQKLQKFQQAYIQDKRYLVEGCPLWVRTFVSSIENKTEREPHLLIAAVDISLEINKHVDLKVKEKKLRKLVDYDSLTGLKSRRAMKEEILDAFFDYQAKQKQSVLVFLDVDNFKNINDSYGHQTGDEVLKRIGAYLEQNIRESDEAGRIGGDEFAVLLRRSEHVDVKPVIERLSNPITVSHNETKLVITLSLGACAINDKISSSEDWLNIADQAMYKNKKQK